MVNVKKIKSRMGKLLLILLTFSSLQLFAQKSSNELSIYGSGGLSFLCYQSSMSPATSMGYTGELGIGFTAFVSQQCGFYFGAGLNLLNLKVKVGDLKNFSPKLTDSNNLTFDLYTTLSGYRETHKTTSVSFPIMFLFQTRGKHQWNWRKSQKVNFYAMGGVKLQLLLYRNYYAQVTTLYNAAYYTEANNWATTQTFVGLGDFAGKDKSGKFKMGILGKVAFETGIKWRMSESVYLYTGVYFDLGLNDPTKKFRKPVSDYTSVEQLSNLSLLSFYDSNMLVESGIKLRIAFMKPSKIIPCR